MNRGSSAASRRGQSGGYRFNEAPIHESGKFECRGIVQSGVIASMRPRFMNRGSYRALYTYAVLAALQ